MVINNNCTTACVAQCHGNLQQNTIDEEEDTLLREKFKDLMKADNISLDTVKHAFSMFFPPLTAPGSVRRAFRQAEDQMSPEQKKAFDSLGQYIQPYYMSRVMKQGQDPENFNINNLLNNNDLNSYISLMGQLSSFLNDIKPYNPQVDFDNLQKSMKVCTNELQKYI